MYPFTVFRHELLFPLPTIQRYATRIAHTVRFHRRKAGPRGGQIQPVQRFIPVQPCLSAIRRTISGNNTARMVACISIICIHCASLSGIPRKTERWYSKMAPCKTPRRFNPQIKSSRPSLRPVAPFRQSISTQSYPKYVVKASFSTAFMWPTPTEVWCLKPPRASLIIFSCMSGTWQTPAQPK